MFLNNKKSILNEILDSYDSLFVMWNKESFNDGSIDEISYTKDTIKIIFQEDLREHITNLLILDSKKRIGKIYYREIVMNNEMIGVDEIKSALLLLRNKNNSEKQEVDIYINFLKLNEIL